MSTSPVSIDGAAPVAPAHPRQARAPWLPPRTVRLRPAVTGRPARTPVTVTVEVAVTGDGAVSLGAAIADQFRALASALADQAGSAVSVTAAIGLTPAPPEKVADTPAGGTRLRIDPGRRLALLDGRQVGFTRREFDLLVFLAGKPGHVYTRTQLLQSVWGHAFVSGERTVDVHVRRIRAKLRDHGETFVGTVRGVGYRFGDPALVTVNREVCDL
jgi:two-component system OmpR family response regulator